VLESETSGNNVPVTITINGVTSDRGESISRVWLCRRKWHALERLREFPELESWA
jgi:hypothetical protein